MLVRLVYASRSTGPARSEVILDILTQSRQHNNQSGITGVLCVCTGDVFMQVLEGSRTEVNRLYSRLVHDTRHTDVTLLDYTEITERKFASWRMGRVDLDKVNTGLVLKYSEKTQFDPFTISGKAAMALLDELLSTASIIGGN